MLLNWPKKPFASLSKTMKTVCPLETETHRMLFGEKRYTVSLITDRNDLMCFEIPFV